MVPPGSVAIHIHGNKNMSTVTAPSAVIALQSRRHKDCCRNSRVLFFCTHNYPEFSQNRPNPRPLTGNHGLNPMKLGSIPWRSRVTQVRYHFLCRLVLDPPPSPHPCPPSCARTQMCPHVEDLISICRITVNLTAGGMVTHKYCMHYSSHIYTPSPRGRKRFISI